MEPDTSTPKSQFFYSNGEIITELAKAKAEGYLNDFIFEESLVFWDKQPEVKYWIANLVKETKVCLLTETIVFRIEFPCGKKVALFSTINN